MVVATRYYDEDLLARLGILDDICWLFVRGAVGHFLEIKEHTYRDLTLEFLSTLHVEVTRVPQCQAGYMSFYLLRQLYELNLGTFNSIFGFPPSMDLSHRQVLGEFNLNVFLSELSGSVRYSTSSLKCTHNRNPCIRVAQRILACSLYAWDDSMNVLRLSELCFLSCMLDGDQFELDSFVARQLHSAAISTKGQIVIGGMITTIARFLGVEPNHVDRVSGYERLNQATFEIMNFCKVETDSLYWIYPEDRLLPLPNVDRTTLLHRGNLYWVPGDEEVVRPAPLQPIPRSSQAGPSSSSHPPPPDYYDLQDTLRSIQEEQVSI